MTDVDGVRGRDGERLDTISPDEAQALIDDGTIAGGMVPKVKAALSALSWDEGRGDHRGRLGRERPRRALDDPSSGRGSAPAPTPAPHDRGGGHAPKRDRHAAIRRLVGARPIASQGELVGQLSDLGIEVTQATVSRDIAELGLAKVMRGDHSVYVLPEAIGSRARPSDERLRRILADIPVTVGRSGLILVLNGQPGTANVIAQAIEESTLDGFVGTRGRRQYPHRAVPRRAPLLRVARPVRRAQHGRRRGRAHGGSRSMNKVVLAYSGGLDTSVAVAWLREQYGAEVVTLTVDLGGGSIREGVERRAMSAGASKAYVVDARRRSSASTSGARSRPGRSTRARTRWPRRSPGRCSPSCWSRSPEARAPTPSPTAAPARATTRSASTSRSTRSIPGSRSSRRCASGWA